MLSTKPSWLAEQWHDSGHSKAALRPPQLPSAIPKASGLTLHRAGQAWAVSAAAIRQPHDRSCCAWQRTQGPGFRVEGLGRNLPPEP